MNRALREDLNRSPVPLRRSSASAAMEGLGEGELVPVQESGQGFVVRGDRVYVVVEGTVVVWAIHLDGTQSITDFAGPGSVVHLAVDDLYYFRVEALTACVIRDFPLLAFRRDPLRSEQLLSQQIERNKALRIWMAYQTRPSLEDRLWGVLHLLSEQFGRATPTGIQIDIPLNHRILAATTGSSRATITRMLSKFVGSGRLRVTGDRTHRRYCLPTD